MNYAHTSKIILIIGLFFLTRYFYKVNDFNKTDETKKEKLIRNIITAILIPPIFLAFGTSIYLIMDMIPRTIAQVIGNQNYIVQVLTMYGFILFYFLFLIWRDGKRKKKKKEFDEIKKISNERYRLIDKVEYLQNLLFQQENEIEELKNELDD